MNDEPLPDGSSPPASVDDAAAFAERAANDDGVRDKLAKEAAHWSADRSGRAHADAADALSTEVKRTSVRAKARVKRAVKAEPAAPEAAPGKPFTMSYDGVSSREYFEQTLTRRRW